MNDYEYPHYNLGFAIPKSNNILYGFHNYKIVHIKYIRLVILYYNIFYIILYIVHKYFKRRGEIILQWIVKYYY